MPTIRTGESYGTHHIVERQMLFHDAVEKAEREEPARKSSLRDRFLTLSRELGSSGDDVARELAGHLGWRVFDREIVESIAADTKVRQQLVSQLDERAQNLIHESVQRLLRLTEGGSFGVPEYHESLLKTRGILAMQGNSIIVGRGANFALRGTNGLHVRITESLEQRIARTTREWGVTAAEARARLEAADAEKREFIRQHFHADIGDPRQYDVSFCADHLSTEQLSAAILGVLGFPPAAR